MKLGNSRPDLVLKNGALVEIKARSDASGANVISELHIVFSDDLEIPLGGITTQVLREIPLAFLINEVHAHARRLKLSEKVEGELLTLLRDYPSSPGRVPVAPIYPASIAYFYEKFLGQKPYQPNAAISEALGVPLRTVGTRVAKARSLGFLESGPVARTGGKARGRLSASGKTVITEYLKEQENEH